ncbi:MAG: hypothetical protein HPY62_05670 [Bacteroidales bacterium]|nr:hypothetical protein [Bacteroidales bacterium]
MKRHFPLFSILLFLSFVSYAQDLNYPAMQGFSLKTNYPVYVPENLWDFINGAADNYLAYGFQDLHVAEYKKGKDIIKLEIYRHTDNINTFGIYSSERSPNFRFVNLGAQGYIADGAVNFFKGNYYVKIRTYSKKPKVVQVAETLAYKVADMLPGQTEMPALLSQFPSEGKKINEETYINQSVLGYSFLNKAFKALYQAGSDNFSIFLFENPSAGGTLQTVKAYLKAVGSDENIADEGKIVLNDKYNGTVFLAWKGTRMVMITGLAKDQSGIADRYASDILGSEM